MQFSRQSVIAFAVGAVCTFSLMFSLGADRAEEPTTPHYMISSWSRPHDPTDNDGWNRDHGAYRVDTLTGQVLEIIGNRCGDVK